MTKLNLSARWMSLWLAFTALLSGCAPATAPTTSPTPTQQGIVRPLQSPIQINDFTLTNQDGQTVTFAALHDKPLLMFFGFTHCPDVCPITLANMRNVRQELGEQADAVKMVFVSVDGKRDTPEVLAKHLALYDADFIGLTGPEDVVRVVTQQFGVQFRAEEPRPDGSYNITHTASTFLVDTEGKLRTIYSYGTDPDLPKVVAADIRNFLAGQ
ncbi:MAG: SCO family protein [Anaerolineae bacterium]